MQSETPPAPSRAGRLPLVGGRLCLDYANTTSGRGGPRRQEHLRHYSHVIAWARHSGVLGEDEASRLSATAEANPELAEAALAEAVALREAIHRAFLASTRGERGDPAALAALNRVLTDGMSRARLLASEQGYDWGWEPWTGGPPPLAAPLWPIARSAAELLISPWRERVRECPGAHCGWLFLDLTKNRSRRWCEMEVCGSRAKMQRYRARRRHRGAE
jgi:predicted RNA-binding Zn ribbon-like protein